VFRHLAVLSVSEIWNSLCLNCLLKMHAYFFSTSCCFKVPFCEFLNFEESDRGCGESLGDDGSSGDGKDSEESDTTGMIFFLFFFLPSIFLTGISSIIFILVLVPMACNTAEEMAHTYAAYLIIAWQT
jgi:hypothetical protein